MEIDTPLVIEEGSTLRIVSFVVYGKGTRSLWYSTPKENADLLDRNSLDPFLLGLLPVAMRWGENISLKGPVSKRLLWNVNRGLQVVLQALIPRLNIVDVAATELAETSAGPTRLGVATGFSGGVDSFSVLVDHYYQVRPSSPRITHLLFFNVGSHLQGGRDLFYERLQRLQLFASRVGLPLIPIDSNLDEFYAEAGLSFSETFTVRNVAAAAVLQGGISTYLYASGFRYQDVYVGESRDIAVADPVLLPLLSTDRLEAIGVGGERSRVSKTMMVSEIEDSKDFLEVCWLDSGVNCGKCLKCIRTLLTLEIGGKLQLYGKVFDLQEWHEKKEWLIGRLLSQRDPLVDEIIDFARQRGYKFSWRSRMVGQVLGLSLRNGRIQAKLRRFAEKQGLVKPVRASASA